MWSETENVRTFDRKGRERDKCIHEKVNESEHVLGVQDLNFKLMVYAEFVFEFYAFSFTSLNNFLSIYFIFCVCVCYFSSFSL